MERKLLLGILAATLFASAAAILLPGGRTLDPSPKLPWDIATDAQGRPTVFTLTLGASSLADARQLFEEEGKINLFVGPDERYAIEAFFEKIYLSGLRADFVLALDVDQDTAAAMHHRGLRISKLGSGSQKVNLAAQDLEQVAHAPIKHITYLPAAGLDPQLIERRFGEPAERLTEDTGIQHWLYPEKGLDIGLDPDGNAVLQYFSPKTFAQTVAPLRAGIPAVGL